MNPAILLIFDDSYNWTTYSMYHANRWYTVCDIKPSLLIYRKKDKVDQNLVWYVHDKFKIPHEWQDLHDGLCPTVWTLPDSAKCPILALNIGFF